MMNGRDQRGREPDGSPVDEHSPLLRVMREKSTSYEGSYMSMPPNSNGLSTADGQFRPIVFAEKALGALLNGVLMYALCCIIGLALVSLNFEGVLGERINWWLIFMPFWVANICVLVAHVSSLRHAKQLRQWADIDSMSNEPLLPLLRRIVMVYAVTVPLSVLLLWSELAFCARLQNAAGTSLYICYAPIMVIQVAYFIRYLLCRSDSTLPGIGWILSFVFTLLLAYQTNTKIHAPEVLYPLSWWTVMAPLFVFQVLMGACLLVVLYYEFAGIYRMTRWQLGASVLYAFALFTAVLGQLMLLENIDYHWGSIFFPSTLMFLGLVSASVAMYIVGRHHVEELMATRGGAVPVPLTKTTAGWITSHAVVENWILFGDIFLTEQGLDYRNQKNQRRNSAVDSDTGGLAGQVPIIRRLKALFRGKRHDERDSMLGASEPERRIQNILRRKTSGSYSDIVVEVDTPK
ncbi:TPA: hypothetical protein N0F65_011047 [Lagenidium giganteum]|uniref:Transmembrane protein n=1 Tax=Lagenidium giganteum TaxID=4803 RepID=A0AAV2ZI42_9STRA|nr:TPA: hypothetical protein N0F65_011047 [Lagenidium giganteum]